MTAKQTKRKRKPTVGKKAVKTGGTQCGSKQTKPSSQKTPDATGQARASDGTFLPGGAGGPGRGRGSRNFKSRLLDAITAYEAERGIDLFAEIVRQARMSDNPQLLSLLVNKTVPTPSPNAIEGEDLTAVIDMFEQIEDAMTSSRRNFKDVQSQLDTMRSAVLGLRRVACKALGIPIEHKVTIKWVESNGRSNGNGKPKLRPVRR